MFRVYIWLEMTPSLVKLDVHIKKLHNLGWKNRYECYDLDKVIFNYSSYKLSDLEKRLLVKGLNYALPSIKLNYGNYMKPFKLFFVVKYGSCPLKIMSYKKLRQRLKRKDMRRLIMITFGMSLILAKKSMKHWKVYPVIKILFYKRGIRVTHLF